MAILMTEGFDMYNGTGANTGLQAAWLLTTGTGNVTHSIVTGRYTGQALRWTGQGVATSSHFLRSIPAGNQTALSIGVAVRLSAPGNVSSNNNSAIVFTDSGNAQCGLRFNLDGSVSLTRNATVFAQPPTILATSAGGLIVANTWHYIEIEVASLHASTGAMDVFIDGANAITGTGLNNITTVNNTMNGIALVQNLLGGGSCTMDFDDLYVVSGATRLGERRIETLRPNADSVVTWTPNSGANNYSRVNETLVDGDTTYVSSSTLNQRDLYSISSLSTTPASIDCVNVVSFAYKTDAGTRAIRNTIKSDASDATGADHYLGSTYARYDEIYEDDPDGSVAWTASQVNALLIGPKVTV